MSLHYEIAPPLVAEGPARPERSCGPLIVLLHGRGSNERDLLGLRPFLPPEATVVCPRAPHAGDRWGYGPGWAWYRFLGNRTPDVESFEESQALLEEFLRDLPALLPDPVGPLVLGGFSQGGVMSLAYALRGGSSASKGERVHVPHIVNLSGFLPEIPTVDLARARLENVRFFWGHGALDRQIPMEWAEVGRALLRDVAADLEAIDYEAGHTITREELTDLTRWLPTGEDP